MPWWARLGVSFLSLPAVVLWHIGQMLPEIATEVRTVVPDLRRQDKDALGARDARLTGVWFDRSGEGSGPSGVATITRLSELPALVLQR